MRLLSATAALAAVLLILSTSTRAEKATALTPRAELVSAPRLRLPGDVDSNSPAVWDLVRGREFFFVLTSSSGVPKASAGRRIDSLGMPREVVIDPWPGGGVWMEAIVPDVDGTWYGYYHNEHVAEACGVRDKAIPQIGAVRSTDHGRTWEPLGVVLEAPPNSHTCETMNQYFVGGVGDFSVQLDADSKYLYFFFSQYVSSMLHQGVGVARLAWAHRDDPVGRMMVWSGRTWLPPSAVESDDGERSWSYSAALPVFPAAMSWHHPEDPIVDAFWGPSVHWNTHLQRYVMLLNRASDATWRQEGVYVSYAPVLDHPRLWSPPVKIMDGGGWYPQVIGLERGVGTDRIAGEWARLFVAGVSEHFIRFRK